MKINKSLVLIHVVFMEDLIFQGIIYIWTCTTELSFQDVDHVS